LELDTSVRVLLDVTEYHHDSTVVLLETKWAWYGLY